MTKRLIQQIHREIAAVQTGKIAPARVWDVRPDGKGGCTRRALNPKAFQRAQKVAWDKGIVATRQKLGLSQTKFAQLLGISVRTLHHWEQGTRSPSGAARVLLRIAALNPKVVLNAAA